ncbi:MAG TPA: hypothetical protein VJ962_09790 [Clostridia bacterium]|nr:hypothetical protein [Clostridia bacterium]
MKVGDNISILDFLDPEINLSFCLLNTKMEIIAKSKVKNKTATLEVPSNINENYVYFIGLADNNDNLLLYEKANIESDTSLELNFK